MRMEEGLSRMEEGLSRMEEGLSRMEEGLSRMEVSAEVGREEQVELPSQAFEGPLRKQRIRPRQGNGQIALERHPE